MSREEQAGSWVRGGEPVRHEALLAGWDLILQGLVGVNLGGGGRSSADLSAWDKPLRNG